MNDKIENVLFENNIIVISGEITEELSIDILKKIATLKLKFEENYLTSPQVTIIVSSIGGSVQAGLAIYDALMLLKAKCTLITVAYGIVASIATYPFLSANKENRYALPNTQFLLHQPLGKTQGQASDIEIVAKQIAKTKKLLYQILSTDTGKPLNVIEKDLDRDNYLTTDEAINYGLLGNVVTSLDKICRRSL